MSTSIDLSGKVAIVTGGNSGIGAAVVLALAEAGANVVIDYVAHPEATEELERKVAALGDNDYFQTDPHWRDLVPFHEYFDGDTGRGVGASHQTGWTALVAVLLQYRGRVRFDDV